MFQNPHLIGKSLPGIWSTKNLADTPIEADLNNGTLGVFDGDHDAIGRRFLCGRLLSQRDVKERGGNLKKQTPWIFHDLHLTGLEPLQYEEFVTLALKLLDPIATDLKVGRHSFSGELLGEN
jgi:hypothetical protein